MDQRESAAGLRRAWLDGSTPWSAQGLAEAFIELSRPEKGALPAAVHAAEVLWLVDRYGRDDGPAHAVRLDRVRRFLNEHRGPLTEAGLCHHRAGECCEGGSLTLTPGLSHALATLPFTARVWDGSGEAGGAAAAGGGRGAWQPAFDPERVILAALAFDDRADGPARA